MSMRYLILLIVFSFVSMGFTIKPSQSVNGEPAVKINLYGFDNLYQINDDLYRSEQPNKAGMKALEDMGIATVLNLRSKRNDKNEAKKTSLNLVHVPINTWTMSERDILKALQVIETSPKPVLIHCIHGSDRTGAVVAAYRMVYQNWTKEDAIFEFRNTQFGYHEKWFPEIIELLESLNVGQLKRALGK